MAAVTCATVGLSGAVAASAAPAKNTPATQAATNPAGDKGKDKKIPYPRLDATNILTGFTARTIVATGGPNVSALIPLSSTHYTGSARRGHVWVNDGTSWTDLTTRFGTGFFYDIALAPSPSTALPDPLPATLVLPATGAAAGRLRVTVRRADGAILFSDCTVSSITNLTGTVRPLSVGNCTAPQSL
ncbi:hypothetical protein [Microbispora sp. NPDC049633]|uniref:hypothetical protein n=1 Tax=Microbispora sp. NPDC049633 TaxID=3154355 RepID=UPI003429D618